MKENFRIILDENETYDKVADDILKKDNIKNYKKYIENMFIERYFENMNKKHIENMNKDDFQINIIKKISRFPPCLKQVIGSNNYCSLHNENSV